MKYKVILTDCDGVLLDWGHSFSAWMKERGYKTTENYHTKYNIGQRYALSKGEGRKLVKEFNESVNIAHIPSLRDSIEYVRKIHEELGYVFHVITSLSTNPYAIKAREENLKKLYGETFCEKLVCLETGADKNEALEPYRNSGCLWVEDKSENALLGSEMGLESVLMKHRFNEGTVDGSVRQVRNWKEIYQYIKKGGF